MTRCIILIVFVFSAASAGSARAETRDLLWRVVQACVLNHSLTGGAFPCLAVETPQGLDRGYAVVRAPRDKTRIVITPTVRTPGIEAPRLRGANAPDYFQDAWASRRFLLEGLATSPTRGDLAMAVNSQAGRSQDQLHIHLACIRPDVKQTVLSERRGIRADRWTMIKVLPQAIPLYTARFVPGDDLSDVNVFDQAAQALKVDADGMDGVTIVVLGVEADPAATGPSRRDGFILMARKKAYASDQPHGEGLLDPACSAFRGPPA